MATRVIRVLMMVGAVSAIAHTASVAAPPYSINAGWEDDGTVVRLDTSTDLVGIGTATPAEKLHVVGTLRFDNGDLFGDGGPDGIFAIRNIGTVPNRAIVFEDQATGSVRLHLDTDNGNVGIGTTTPGAKLDVVGAIRTNNQLISTVATGTAPLAVSSTTKVANLNADFLDGLDSTVFSQLGNSIESSEITDGTILDADVAASAAIAGTKVSPNFGSQNLVTLGNVGIGTAVPVADLDVAFGAGNFARIGPDTGEGFYIQGSQSGAAGAFALRVDGQAGHPATFNGAGGANVMTLLSNGNVGIGTTEPASKLQVSDSGSTRAYFKTSLWSTMTP